MYGHPDALSDSVRMAIHFFVNFDIFKWLYLSYYWVYLHQTWGFCKTLSTLCGSIVANPIIYGFVPSPSRFEFRQYSYREKNKTHELIFSCSSWLAALLVGAYTRRRRRRYVESRNMAVIFQIIGWQRHAALVYRVLLWYWKSLLWSIDTFQNKVSADQYHMTISRAQGYNLSRSRFFSWSLTKCWFWIGSRALDRLTYWKQGRIVRKSVNASPGLIFIRIITFSSMQMFFAALFCVYGDYETQNRKPNN